MQLRGPERGTTTGARGATTGARGPALGAPLPSGTVRRHVLFGAAITALGGLLFGYDTGVISGALLFIGRDFSGLTSFEKELLTSILLIGALVGALAGGRIADRAGRRPTVLGTAALFVAGVMLAAFSTSYGVLVGARVIIGLAVGSASMVVPLYIGEVVPPRVRGALVSFNQLAITSGILASYLVDYGLASSQNWRLMFGLAAIPAVLMFTGMLFQRESPHWLIAQGREAEAREVLRLVRDEGGIDAEIAEVRALSGRRSSYREVLNPAVRHVMVIGVAMAVFQQITGINTIIYYAPTLLSAAGLGNSAALLANVVNGAVNVLMTIVAIRLLDRAGRRPLLLGGTAGMAAGMLVVALTFGIGGSQLHGGAPYIAIAGLLLYTGSFAIGLGPVFWLLISEIYPVKIRGQAMSVATMANWGANFVVTISFLTLLSAIGNAGTFFLFAGLSVVALAYFQRQVPETKNRSLQDIERDLDLPQSGDDPQHHPVSGTRPEDQDLHAAILMKHPWRALAGLGGCMALLLVTGLLILTSATAATAARAIATAPAGDSPPGFWWGTDSLPVTVPGSAPYQMPYLGGAYGGYIGMTGNWAYWLGCSGQEHFLALSATDDAQAHSDYVTYHTGVGSGAYWFMGGPGVDPNYSGTTAEASTWGARQAARALSDIANGAFDYKVVWMDIELPGITPAPDNGWNSVYTSACSGVVKQSYVPTSLDRADFNGFWDYVSAHSAYKVGVYSSAGVWASIFGTGSDSLIPHTYEWTYEPETTNYSGAYPYGWCLDHGAGPCAQFFGGQTSASPYALMWQWSGGGGATNGIGGFNGDLDTIDAIRQN